MSARASRGEVAARYARVHEVSLAEAARRFGVSRERVRQKWRDLFGDEPTPTQEARSRRAETIAALASTGLSASEIGCEIDLHPNAVCAVRDRVGFTMVSGKDKVRVTEETRAKILELAHAGKTRAEIAHETGASYSVVTKYLKGRSTRGTRGPAGSSARASEAMDRTGCSLCEAAAKYVVPPPALWAYRRRRGLWTSRRGD